MRGRFARFGPVVLAVVAGLALRYCADAYLVQFVIGWRRPVQDWLMSIGLGPIAPHYALLNLELPTVALAALAGLLIGRVAPGRWLALSLAFAAGMSVIGQTFQTWRSFAVGYVLPARILATVMGIGALAAFLPTLSMAWLFSRTARISQARKAAGRCGECGYDLRATTAPRCPECGAANGPGTRFGLGQPNATERFDENGLRRP